MHTESHSFLKCPSRKPRRDNACKSSYVPRLSAPSQNTGSAAFLNCRTGCSTAGVMDINVGALVAVVLFYIIILGVGLWAARRNREGGFRSDDLMLAGRRLGTWTGAFTTTATWVGGGYINGIVEVVFSGGSEGGLVWCQGPFGYALSLLFGGLLFAKRMREAGYVTMLDPFGEKFGPVMGGLLFLPALLGELLWSASILASLGATVEVIIGVGYVEATIASACVAVVYTTIGGLWSVAYTDVVQLGFIFCGLWICAPFALTYSDYVRPIGTTSQHWLGTVEVRDIGRYIDNYLLLICGGIPWQVYFQRVHAAKSAKHAQNLSLIAAAGCFIMCIPSILIGAVADSTDWNSTEFGHRPDGNEVKLVLPLVLDCLTPKAVAIVGLGVICAAVMASADSSILSASSMFSRNIYKMLLRQKASDKEVLLCMRLSVVWVGAAATAIGILVPTVYGLWFLCSDLVYVILFPQLTTVIYYENVNTYGALSGYLVGLTLRLLGGEGLIGLPAAVHYPYYDTIKGQLFPFRTLAMLCSLVVIVVGSECARWIFTSSKAVSQRCDFLGCFRESGVKANSSINGDLTMYPIRIS